MAAERVLAVTAGYAVFRSQQAGAGVQFAGDLLFAFGTAALALGYAATLILVAQTPRGRAAILAPLVAVGRLALTVYLTQTMMFTTLFYGYGFGQAFRLGPGCCHRLGGGDLRRAGRRVSVVVETFSLRPNGVVVALPDLPEVATTAPPKRFGVIGNCVSIV